MISKCADFLTDLLIKNNGIEEQDRDLYQYAIYIVLLTISPIFLAIAYGTFFGCIIESVWIILPFMIIRKFSGGYHTEHAWTCFTFSSILLISCIYCSQHITNERSLLIVTFVSILTLSIFSPIEHVNHPLTQKEKVLYQRYVHRILFVLSMIILFMYLLHYVNISKCLSIGIILSAILQLPCIISQCINKF